MNLADRYIQSLIDSGKYQPKKLDLQGVSPELKAHAEAEEQRLQAEIEALTEQALVYWQQIQGLNTIKEGYTELLADLHDEEFERLVA